ncbi:MAG: PAC2 family protein [Chloroflexi bacterium]|nr:PAC2 family protein [Chloroflexota bacterium]
MSHLILHELPELRQPILLAAFAGWPDAGEVASGAVHFLRRALRARKFAEIDPQPFYDFTRTRPTSRMVGPGLRELVWPSCDFTCCQGDGERDLVLFLAQEPQLQWQTFIGAVLELAEQVGVQLLVALGGTYDSVAHTRPPVITGSASESVLRRRLQRLGVGFSDYEGPTSIHSALLQAARERHLSALSLWGHAPHYVTNVPNPKVSYGLLATAGQLLGFTWDLVDLQRAGEALAEQVDQALEEKPELKEYVRRLEGPAEPEPPGEQPSREGAGPELPAPEAVVRDLEDFLRQLRQDDEPDE